LRLSEDLITFFRDLLLLQTSENLAELLELVSPEERVFALAHDFAPDMLYGYIDILAKTQQEMRFSHHTKIYLETALLKMTQFSGGVAHQVGTSSEATMSPELAQKIVALEQMVQQLSAQLQNGVPAQSGQATKEQRPRAKSSNGYKAPTGRIQEVLKDATKQDVQRIKAVWAQALNQMQKSQSALLAEAEPVAASSSAFVLKFKYDIHCQMVADNQTLKAQFTQLIAGQTGTMYEMLCTPEETWLKLREEFIRDHGLHQKKTQLDSDDPNVELLEPPPAEMPEEPFIDDAQPLASQDPLVTEAEKLFGKDFIEIIEE